MNINHIIRLENGLAFAASFYFYIQLDFPLLWFFLLLLVPDITMLGYTLNKKIGAMVYNLGHSFTFPILLSMSYLYFSKDYLLMISIIWLAHIFMDRLFGFGLKYTNSFKKTHIQKI